MRSAKFSLVVQVITSSSGTNNQTNAVGNKWILGGGGGGWQQKTCTFVPSPPWVKVALTFELRLISSCHFQHRPRLNPR